MQYQIQKRCHASSRTTPIVSMCYFSQPLRRKSFYCNNNTLLGRCGLVWARWKCVKSPGVEEHSSKGESRAGWGPGRGLYYSLGWWRWWWWWWWWWFLIFHEPLALALKKSCRIPIPFKMKDLMWKRRVSWDSLQLAEFGWFLCLCWWLIKIVSNHSTKRRKSLAVLAKPSDMCWVCLLPFAPPLAVLPC